MIDSGNNLEDYITGKPVHIITSKTLKKLTSINEKQKIRYVPYHTIQEEEGVLPVIKLDKMKRQFVIRLSGFHPKKNLKMEDLK